MENDNREQEQKSPKAETEQPEPAATVKKAEGRADVPPASRANNKADGEQKYRRTVVLLTAVIAGATVAYSVSAYWQLRILGTQAQAMNETLVETRGIAEATKLAAEATIASGKAAQDSADAAKESNRITLQMARNDQRAWIGTKSLIGEEIRPGVRIQFGVIVANLGKTPAKKVKTQTSWRALPRTTPFSPVYNKSTTNIEQMSTSVLMPTFEGTLLAPPITLGEDQVEALRSGRAHFYVYGRITYEDVFGRSHKTTWCLFVNEKLDRMAACEIYNDAD